MKKEVWTVLLLVIIFAGAYAYSSGDIQLGPKKKVTRTTQVVSDAATCPSSQTWENRYGAGLGYAVQKTKDCGYIIAGKSYGGNSPILLKISNNGSLVWNKTYQPYSYPYSHGGEFRSVLQTSDQGYIASGRVNLPVVGGGGYITKTNSQGTVLWNKVENATDFFDIVTASDGGYVIPGIKYSSSSAPSLFLMKIDDLGNEQWRKDLNLRLEPSMKIIRSQDNNGYVIVGTFYNLTANPSETEMAIIKTDNQGNSLWQNIHGFQGSDEYGFDIESISNGGYIGVGCSFCGPIVPFGPTYDGYAMTVNSSGGFERDIIFGDKGGSNFETISSITKAQDEGYVLVGVKHDEYYESRLWVIKTNPSITEIQESYIGTLTNPKPQDVKRAHTSNQYVVVGGDSVQIYATTFTTQ